jgi:hypothetical protein
VSTTQENPSTVADAAVERCKQLEARVRALELERSDLLLALARERERANALFLAYPPTFQVASVQPAAQPTKLPLRHRLIDALNEGLKRQFPEIHRAAKDAGTTLLHKLK